MIIIYLISSSNTHLDTGLHTQQLIQRAGHDHQGSVNQVDDSVLNRNIGLDDVSLHRASLVLLGPLHGLGLHHGSNLLHAHLGLHLEVGEAAGGVVLQRGEQLLSSSRRQSEENLIRNNVSSHHLLVNYLNSQIL